MLKDSGRVGGTRDTHRAQNAAAGNGHEGSIPSPGTQKCRTCGNIKPVSAFHKDRVLKDGTQAYRSECKFCKAEKQRVYDRENRERRLKYQARYRRENRDRILAQKRERYELVKSDPVAYGELIRQKTESNRRRRAEAPELYREYARRYRERLKRDPERLAVMRQNRRMAYEARRRIRAEHGGYEAHTFEFVDAAPFKEWVRGLQDSGVSIERLVLGSGVSERSVRRVLAGQAKVKLDLVDRVTMANDVGLWELGYDD